MKLDALIDGLPVQLTHGSASLDITSIVDDSRQAQSGALFVARPGTKADGNAFIAEAVQRGAAAVLTRDAVDAPGNAALLRGNDAQRIALAMAERLHGKPSDRLVLLGVTGTNGKSTTVWLMQQMLSAAGKRCGMISTTRIDDGTASRDATMTTPGALELRAMLGRMIRAGCSHAAVEVSSHGIDQGRVAGLQFAAAVFTNLSGDHLDYHKTMESYADVKARLFAGLLDDAAAIVNVDDAVGERMVRDCGARVLRCSMHDAAADCFAETIRGTIDSTRVRCHGPWGEFDAVTPLVGAHNIMNMLEAAASCASVGVDAAAIKRAIEFAEAPPGRLEVVTADEDPFTVLVDYSHTDGALETVLSELRPLVPAGARLRTLFGCGGDRDTTKRPRMAAAALRFSDDVIITSDNPRSENPGAIIDQILAGVPAAKRGVVTVEEDRHKAIELAVANCRAGDVLVIAGKGHETYQIIGSTTRPFDDRLVARGAIAHHQSRMAAT
jgi:UDP-N-acetylmuramoyl-L-alanyl-D-glutamate--2,6-diaminopimelate ligase